LAHLEDKMPLPLKKFFGAFMPDVYQLAARCRTTNDFIERVNLLATLGTGFKAILFSGIAYELGRLFNITPYHSRERSRIERKIFDEIEIEVYKPQLGVHSEPLRRMCNEGPSSMATLDIADEEFRILEDNYWVYTTDLGDRKLVCPTPTLVSGDLIWTGFDYLCQKNPSPDVMNVDFVKLLKKIISNQIFEMDGLPSRLFVLGIPQKIKFLDCLFEEEVLKVKTAFGPHPIIESELLNHNVAGGIAYIIKSLKNEICIKSTYIMNLASKHLHSDEEFFRGFCSFKKRIELGKSVLYTSGLETFLVLSSLSPVHVLEFFDALNQPYKELFLQIQLDKIVYRYPDLINALPLHELIERLPSAYGKGFEESLKEIAFKT